MTIENQAMTFLLMNGKPNLTSSDKAIERRLRDIPFRFKFMDKDDIDTTNPFEREADNNINNKFKQEIYGQHFMYMLIQHYYNVLNYDICSKRNIPQP